MKRLRTLLTIVVLAIAPPWCLPPLHAADAGWQGTDDKIEEIAKAAGHPAREPYLNLVQGDLGLCAFLVAGAVGGFIAGYAFRNLFPPKSKGPSRSKADHAPHP